jgi:hypothetical protein
VGKAGTEQTVTFTQPAARVRAAFSLPKTWHFASLAVAVLFLALAARNLWFFSDEWDFLIPSNDAKIFAPHVGHWSTTPILVTQALRDLFGIDSYWPYIALSMAVHLVLCHLLWRIMLRVGVNAWIATALATLMIFLGAGSENILWAFQFGFMGAVLLGLVVVLLVDVERVGRLRWIFIELLSIWSLTFAGTAVPLVLAAALVSLYRRGLLRTVLQFLPVAIIYVAWYLTSALGHVVSYGPSNLKELGLGIPDFFSHELVDGLGALFPYSGFGFVIVAALLAWGVHSFPMWRGKATPAFALAVAAIAQALLTAFSRVKLGDITANSGRYVYVLVALLLPMVGLALTWFAHQQRSAVAIIVSLVLVLAAFNGIFLIRESVVYTTMEQNSKARVSAALSLVNRDHLQIAPRLVPAPNFAHDLDMGDLESMYKRGWVHIGPFTEAARLSVLGQVRLVITPDTAPQSRHDCRTGLPNQRISVPAADRTIRVFASQAVTGGAFLTDDGATGDNRPIALHRGWSKISSTSGATLNLRLGSQIMICTR